jgi:hypothetical protein
LIQDNDDDDDDDDGGGGGDADDEKDNEANITEYARRRCLLKIALLLVVIAIGCTIL